MLKIRSGNFFYSPFCRIGDFVLKRQKRRQISPIFDVFSMENMVLPGSRCAVFAFTGKIVNRCHAPLYIYKNFYKKMRLNITETLRKV